MIIAQDLDKNIIGTYTTISGFLRDFNGRGAKIGSYDYVRKLLSSKPELTAIKYKGFLLTKGVPKSGKKVKKKETVINFVL